VIKDYYFDTSKNVEIDPNYKGKLLIMDDSNIKGTVLFLIISIMTNTRKQNRPTLILWLAKILMKNSLIMTQQ
jgi:hypothetical protein